MTYLRRRSWLPLLLFWLTLAVSAALFLLVIVAPLLDNGAERPQGGSQWLALFARDKVLRRTTLASAACLVVTAFVFFRSPGTSRPAGRRSSRSSKHPPPTSMAGA
jgi:hypothetical protein